MKLKRDGYFMQWLQIANSGYPTNACELVTYTLRALLISTSFPAVVILVSIPVVVLFDLWWYAVTGIHFFHFFETIAPAGISIIATVSHFALGIFAITLYRSTEHYEKAKRKQYYNDTPTPLTRFKYNAGEMYDGLKNKYCPTIEYYDDKKD